MSLLKKIKSKLSQRYQASKQERQRRQLNRTILHREVEEARWQGYRQGTLARAQSEGFRQAKNKPGGNMRGEFVKRIKLGVNFMNQDFETVFGDMDPDFGARVFGGQPIESVFAKEKKE